MDTYNITPRPLAQRAWECKQDHLLRLKEDFPDTWLAFLHKRVVRDSAKRCIMILEAAVFLDTLYVF
jgi:hypothetical protein